MCASGENAPRHGKETFPARPAEQEKRFRKGFHIAVLSWLVTLSNLAVIRVECDGASCAIEAGHFIALAREIVNQINAVPVVLDMDCFLFK